MLKAALTAALISLMTTTALASDFEVDQPCAVDGVVVNATAKNTGAFSGTKIDLVCLDHKLAYARMEGFGDDGCLYVVARRAGIDTRMVVKSPTGERLCQPK